jgi:pilus assembly protein Flp/PilA
MTPSRLASLSSQVAVRAARATADARSALRRHDQAGQGMVEYGLILILVAVVLVASLLAFQTPLRTIFNTVLPGLQGTNP